MKINLSILLSFFFLVVINQVFACFITNCPPGGKRSIAMSPYSKPASYLFIVHYHTFFVSFVNYSIGRLLFLMISTEKKTVYALRTGSGGPMFRSEHLLRTRNRLPDQQRHISLLPTRKSKSLVVPCPRHILCVRTGNLCSGFIMLYSRYAVSFNQFTIFVQNIN